MNNKPHIAVLMGGMSSEREVSLASGAACAENIKKAGFKVTEIDVDGDLAIKLDKVKPDVAFNILHGKWGEDGCVQGLLELMKIPYTNSGVLASSLAMNKPLTNELLANSGMPVAENKLVDKDELINNPNLPMDAPFVIKPYDDGSSVGIYIVNNDDQFKSIQQQLKKEWVFGDVIMVEKFISGKELTCAVMGDKPLGVIEVKIPNSASSEFYDYKAKYEKGGSVHELPANISPNIYQNVEELSLLAHNKLGCRGVTRSDFRYNDTKDGNGELVFLEINTQPGMTGTSLVPELAEYSGISFPELVAWLIEDASCGR